ncbi:MAG: hypothetical protein ABEJ65_04805 [bacterium]
MNNKDSIEQWAYRQVLLFRIYRTGKVCFRRLISPLLFITVGSLLYRLDWVPGLIYYALLIPVFGWLGYQFYRCFEVVQTDRSSLLRAMVRLNDRWEPLRAYFCRPQSIHPWFTEKLLKEVQQAVQSGNVLGDVTTRGKGNWISGVIVCFVLPLLIINIQPPSKTASVERNLKLRVSNSSVLEGDTVSVTVTGNPVTEPRLVMMSADGPSRRTEPMKRGNGNSWEMVSPPLEESVRMKAVSAQTSSNKKSVHVVTRAILTGTITRVKPPSYTGISERKTDRTQVSVLPGSRISIEGSVNRTVRELRLFDGDQSVLRAKRYTDRLTFKQPVHQEESYRFTATDTYGFTTRSDTLSVTLRKDGAPSLSLLEPTEGSAVEGDEMVPLKVRFNDDYGLSSARLTVIRNRSDSYVSEIPVPETMSEGELYGEIDVGKLDLMLGDSFKFLVRAWDNDTVNGPKVTTIGPFDLRVYTWKEMMTRRRKKRTGSSRALSRMQKNIERLQGELNELSRNQGSKDWETSRRLQKVRENLEKQKKRLQNVQKNLDSYKKQGPTLSRESLKKLGEVQKMIKKHGMDSLKSAQKKIQKAIKKQAKKGSFNREDLQYSKKQLKQFERNINRMHKFLKNSAPAFKMDEVSRALEKMAKKQKNMMKKDKLSKQNRRELKKQSKQWDWAKKQLKKLKKQTEGKVKKDVKKLLRKMKRQKLSKQARNLSKQQKSSGKKMKKYNRQTRKMRNSMRQLQQKQQSQMKQKQRSLVSKLIDNWTEWYSFMQSWSHRIDQLELPPRYIARYTSQMGQLSQAIQDGIILQGGWNRLAKLTRKISQKSMSFPRPILKKMNVQEKLLKQARSNLKERKMGNVRRKKRVIQREQAEMIAQLLKWKKQQSAKSGAKGKSGGMPSLSQMLRQQRRLMQGMKPLFQSGKVSKQLARQYLQQQQMIRRTLQKMVRQQRQNKDILGDLEKITRQMKRAEKKMKDKEFDKTLQAQQESILKRLEQATKSLSSDKKKRKDPSRKREATVGDDEKLEIDKTRYQKLMDRLQPQLEGMDRNDREAVLRFYRYWFRTGGDTSSSPDIP